MFSSFFKSSVPFTPKTDIPSLKGKVIIVTGGNSGLGKQAILEFARHNPEAIWLATRSAEKAEAAIKDIQKEVPTANIRFLELDLDSFASIKNAVNVFLAASDRLDILMENAGIMATSEGLTKEGYEVQFGTNHVGHALFTKLLLPVLLSTAEQPGADVRVVVLSSAGICYAPPEGIQLDKVTTTCGGMTTHTRYGQSKLANALYARQLAKEYPEITVSSIHPGGLNTNLARYMTEDSLKFRLVWAIGQHVTTSVENGARNQLWASVSKDVINGAYYVPVGVRDEPAAVQDDDLARRLWDWTETQLNSEVD
ncbi:hypothetical protein E8E14_006712 [Neopestalotiopsis sp. 37M]|nr:hypothetical protein E8E14_006712 [Neopestalotiopsis sp. 37M]